MYQLKAFLAGAVLFCVSASVSTVSPLYERGLSSRIINGQAADSKDFPFMASIYIDNTYGHSLVGGSLIAPNLVLSIAFPFIDYNRIYEDPSNDNQTVVFSDFSQVSVHFGNISANHTISGGYKISKIVTSPNIVHPRFIPFNMVIFVLNKDVPSSEATPVEIYNQTIADGTVLQVAGFGSMPNADNVTFSKILNYIDVTTSSTGICKRYFFGEEAYNSTICSEITDSKGMCTGDDGSPLSTVDTGVRKLVGIFASTFLQPYDSDGPLSNGTAASKYKCANNGDGLHYANLPYYSSWIEEQKKAFKSSSPKSSSYPGRLALYGFPNGVF